MMKIGPYELDNNLFLAPMAGVTDFPFRRLCRQQGAGVVVSEMVTSDPSLQNSRKTKLRLAQAFDDQSSFAEKDADEIGLKVVQIAGGDAEILAASAIINVAKGAQVIDINMGCPAKKVCKKAAGSALLKDPKLVDEILKAVVAAVDVPVTLKIRTGWDKENINAVEIAKIAEGNGIQSLAVHGRTKACKYEGVAEHNTVALVKQAISIPVVANGDIGTPKKAKEILEQTGVDGLMIGRPAQGRPWIFSEIAYFLKNNKLPPEKGIREISEILLDHVSSLHRFYGDRQGVRIARKHTGWYLANNIVSGTQEERDKAKTFKRRFNQFESASQQIDSLNRYFR